jgi:predicted MFS family arabinose efflux permease
VTIPGPAAVGLRRGLYDDITRGVRIYLATPRLRSLLALRLSVDAAGSMVFVNTVVLVKGKIGGTDGDVALALACFGGGSMAAALLLPRLLDRLPDRQLMLWSAGVLAAALFVFGVVMAKFVAGGHRARALADVGNPGHWMLGRHAPLRTPAAPSADAADRPAVFAAQFALSHVCWLITYPLAGWLGSSAGLTATLFTLAAVSLAGAGMAARLWPAADPDVVRHAHPDLSADLPHLHGEERAHAHAFVIDDLHTRWP